jgi:hypothetical protein
VRGCPCDARIHHIHYLLHVARPQASCASKATIGCTRLSFECLAFTSLDLSACHVTRVTGPNYQIVHPSERFRLSEQNGENRTPGGLFFRWYTVPRCKSGRVSHQLLTLKHRQIRFQGVQVYFSSEIFFCSYDRVHNYARIFEIRHHLLLLFSIRR